MTSSEPDQGVAPAGARRWRLGLLVLTHAAGTVNIVSVLAMAPMITRDLSLSAVEFGFFVTAYYAAQAVGSIPSGGLVDRFGIGRALVLSNVIMIAGAMILSQADTMATGIVALAVMGIGYSITNPATSRGVFEWFPPERRATAMGIKQVGVPIGGIVAAGNGALSTVVPWTDIMVGIAVVVAVNGVLCLRLTRLPRLHAGEAKRHPLADIRDVAKDWNVTRFTVLSGLYNFGQANFFAFLVLFMRDVALASQPVASLAVGIAQASSAAGRIGWGVISDTVFGGRRKGLTVALGAGAALFLGFLALVGPGWGLYLGMVLALLLGATIASFAPLVQTLVVETAEPRLAGTAIGYNMVGTHIGGMIGPPIFGAVIDTAGGYGTGWLMTAAAVVVGTAILAFWFKEPVKGAAGAKTITKDC